MSEKRVVRINERAENAYVKKFHERLNKNGKKVRVKEAMRVSKEWGIFRENGKG